MTYLKNLKAERRKTNEWNVDSVVSTYHVTGFFIINVHAIRYEEDGEFWCVDSGISLQQLATETDEKNIFNSYRCVEWYCYNRFFNTWLCGGNEQFIGIVFSVIILTYLIVSFLIYLTFHKEMKAIKKNANWAKERKEHLVIDTAFRNQKNTYSNGWFLLSFIFIGVTLFITFFQYDQFPDKIPMQYNFSGDITNWAKKSIKTVLLLPFMQLFLLVLFMFINLMIGRSKQQISVENPEKSAQQSYIFRRRFSLFMIVNGTVLVLLFAIIQLSFMYPIDSKVVAIAAIGVSGLIVIGATMLAFSTGQGGSRVKIGKDKSGDVIDRDDDRYWKLGQFYVNKQNPALFLEKRFGVGWTVNFAHPIVWIIFIGLIVVSVGIPILLAM